MLRITISILLLITIFTHYEVAAQHNATLVQNVRGVVKDAESKEPLVGVIVVAMSNSTLNALTDENGYFTIQNVPVGRQSFKFSYMGYETRMVAEVLVTSGKALELNIDLTEKLNSLKEVTVKASNGTGRALNEFATISARSFSVEETKRYAGTLADPARMAMNFMGVSNSGDMDNGIVVRGNSPKSVLWRLEGIEIPNPNHFSSQGTTGGAISMLNPSMLGTSDFYTGAFPAEMGNALSGVFDINYRNGNKNKREHTFQLGALGTEIASEGPFKKDGGATYLFNYRYSTLALLKGFFDFGGVLPEYQDASFKVHLPTKKAGTFSIFGLGGYNSANKDAKADSSKWDDEDPNFNLRSNNTMAVVGVGHTYFLNKRSYLKTVLSTAYEKSQESVDTLNPAESYKVIHTSDEYYQNTAYRLSVLYNNKINSKNTIRIGVRADQLNYDLNNRYFDEDDAIWKSFINSKGGTQYYQAYAQWKRRITKELTVFGGLHGSYYALNSKASIEPRASITYQKRATTYSLSAGLHTKPEHVSVYRFQNMSQKQAGIYPNKNLNLQRAMHIVAGYQTALPLGIRFKTEVYYQHLYNIPVAKDSTSEFSTINALDIYSLANNTQLVSEGTGRNYGIDFSFERPFANNYYFTLTSSIYNSTYTTYGGERYNTMFNRGYQLNVLGGKEFKVGKNGKNVLGVNGKVLYSGGMRESKIDLAKSIAEKETNYVPGEYYTQQTPAYLRFDATIYYKMNKKKSTHSIQLDVQNITNRQNHYFSYFDSNSGSIKTVYQLGIFPNIAYRIDFQW